MGYPRLPLGRRMNERRSGPSSDHEELRTMSATLSATYRTLLISSSEATRSTLGRLLEASDIGIDDMVEPDQVIASVARRAPDLIVLDVEADAITLSRVCGLLKANPTTLLVPLVGLAKSSKQRLLAF